ncbi:MAG TPA: MraY family glycosyltransferase [bacterium]|nr:MraY family glycosyltransferase [bacterium]
MLQFLLSPDFPLWGELVLLALASFALSIIGLWGGVLAFRRIGWLDRPHLYPHERGRAPIPYGLGIILPAVFTLVMGLMLSPETPKLPVLLAFGLLVSIVSFPDDLDTIKKSPFKVPPIIRLAFQVAVGVVIGFTSIKIGYISGLFGGIAHIDDYVLSFFGYNLHIVAIAFTVFWYVLVFNALNWSDGVAGLTSGIALIALAVIALLTTRLYLSDTTLPAQENSLFVFRSLAALVPAVIVIGWADMRRRIVMGDSGTMFLAFVIASLAIVSGGKVATVATVLGVYLVDAMYVIFMRIASGQNPLKGDITHHLHFRLRALGLRDSDIRLVVFSLSAAFGVAAIFLDRIGKVVLFLLLVLIVFSITRIVRAWQGKTRDGGMKE